MKPLTKWNAVLDRSADIPRVFRKAFEAMTTGRPGAAHIALPFDVQNGPWSAMTCGPIPRWCVSSAASRPTPRWWSLRPSCCGRRSSRYSSAAAGWCCPVRKVLTTLAENLSAPVATTISGKGSIDERCAHSVGVVGSNGGTPETRAVVDAAD